MTTANSTTIIDGAGPAAPLPVDSDVYLGLVPVDMAGWSVSQPVYGGPPDGPQREARPIMPGVMLPVGAPHVWESDLPLNGWHGRVAEPNLDAHVGVMERDYTPRPTSRRAPVLPWDAGTEANPTPTTVVF